ncbi:MULTISPECIES: hypothetical protein [Undibacterium]|uniref:Uncharacterized protein n=1 Tax=Undibacterium umbellatum TaxID=2762300 RepID=A0ABR6ZJA2_9BURK|nr:MULTISPECIES: hypothetical protein [Undibacterium]MBC3911327.1 hypothetical protein [Undibacterium umbellatum]MDP1976408.1 hypothetical protein [Undibacterium sp.]
MKTTKQRLIAGIFCALFSSGVLSPALAADVDPTTIAQRGDPERWYQEETTPMAYFKTLKKEAEAVHQLSVVACKQMDRTQQNQCLREARNTMQQDMADAYRKSGIRPR